jgi:ribose/xylose/arabinose/galactoside ABC-type transport system permease subunit
MKLFSRDDPHVRPLLILAGCILGLALIDAREVLTAATAASAFETFATIGLVALGLGLTMMIREFDLSVVGMYSLAGCIAVVMGGDNAWLGLACALAAGVLGGLAQGFIIVRLRLGSVGVTLGGLLVFAGIAYVVTENRALPILLQKSIFADDQNSAGRRRDFRVQDVRDLTASRKIHRRPR